jgi:tetratricopeptide (TPR) repeat protein
MKMYGTPTKGVFVLLAWLFLATGCGPSTDTQAPEPTEQQETTQQTQADAHRDMMTRALMIRVGKVDIRNSEGHSLTANFTAIDSDLIVTRASYFLNAVEAQVRLQCCDPRTIVGVVAYDFGLDIAVLQVDSPFEGFVKIPVSSAHPIVGEECTILYNLPIEFETGPAYSEHPTLLASTPTWDGIGRFGLFRYQNDIIFPGSLIVNDAFEPVAVLTRWGGGRLEMGVWIDDIMALDRHAPIPLDEFSLETIDPDEQSNAYALLSGIYRDNHMLDKARQAAEQGVEIDPMNWHALYEFGVITDMLSSDYPLSASYLERSVEIEGDWVESVYSLGLLRYKQGRFSDAKIAFEQALTIDFEHPDSHAMLGLTVWKLSGAQSAISVLELACDNAPDQYGFLSNYVNAMQELDRESETIGRLEAFIKDEPKHEEARAKLAYIAFRAKRFALAAKQFEQVCRVPEPVPNMLAMLAYSQIVIGKLDSAEENLGRLMRAEPGHPIISQLKVDLRKARED